MKLAHILAGAAALALTAGAASAQTVTSPGGSSFTVSAPTVTPSNPTGPAGPSAGATFNLRANVAEDCSFFTGSESGNVDINFGTLGIFNTSTQGLGQAFRMTGPASATATTSVAGCNTANRVRIEKDNGSNEGMKPEASVIASGFDPNQFQANLPYRVVANYTAVPLNSNVPQTMNWIEVETVETGDTVDHGAWKSQMQLTFQIPQAAKAVVAGNYTGRVSVTLFAI